MPKRPIHAAAFDDKDGNLIVLDSEAVYADNHPWVKARPELFEDHEVDVIEGPPKRKAAPVEQASAAPGEQRATIRQETPKK